MGDGLLEDVFWGDVRLGETISLGCDGVSDEGMNI